MAWIESHQSLGLHPKLLRLSGQLKISRPQAVGHLHYLWWWAMEYAIHGDLTGFQYAEISDAAEWKKDPKQFVEALISSGFLNKDLSLHDWMDYASKMVSIKEWNNERQRRCREKTGHTDVIGMSQKVCDNVTGMSQTPDRTKPYQTPKGGTGSTEEVPRAPAPAREEPSENPRAKDPPSTPAAVQDSVVQGKDVNWPTREEWHRACEMESLSGDQEQSEWDNQERKPPTDRWRKISVDRLRHHAAFVRSKWQERGCPGPGKRNGPHAKDPSFWELKYSAENLEKMLASHRGRPDSIADSVAAADRQDYREKKAQLNGLRERMAAFAKTLTPWSSENPPQKAAG